MSSPEDLSTDTADTLPTITVAIVSHGMDLITKELPEFDPNVRIFSRAGQALCLGVVHENNLGFVIQLYGSRERSANKNTKSSYQMLRQVADHYNSPENNSEYTEMCDREIITKPYNIKPLKHTKKTINCKKHNQIYTPSYDHTYIFTDETSLFSGQNQIIVLETINYTSRNNVINYEDDTNLALQKFYIDEPNVNSRNILQKDFRKEMILEFLMKFNLDTDSESELYKYCDIIFENIPFVNNGKIMKEFQNPTSAIHRFVKPEDDVKITEKVNEFLGILDIKDVTEKKRILDKKKEFLNTVGSERESVLIQTINLSEIIAFLKSEGFKVINIIDFSCRGVHKYLDEAYLDLDESKLEEEEEKEKRRKKEKKQERIREYEEEQLMGSQEVKQNIGGKKKRRKTRRNKRRM